MKLFVASLLCISVLGLSAFSFPYVYDGTLISNIAAALGSELATSTPEAPEIAERKTEHSDDLIPQADQFFAGNGTGLATSNWGASAAGPFSLPFTAGNVANFATVNGTGTGGSIAIGGINATENLTLTSVSGTISNQGNVVVPIVVASGRTLDFAAQSFTSSATAGYNFTGPGTLALAGNTYGGGFTINSGTLVARGVNAMGGGAANALTINGGIIASNANRDFSAKYNGGITIGGDFQIGALSSAVPLSSNTANLTFSNSTNLGALTRSITIGANGDYTFGGVFSGGVGTGITVNALPGATGRLIFSGANTYTGVTTLSGGILSVATIGNGGVAGNLGQSTNAASNIVFDGGTLRHTGSTASTNRNFTINSGKTAVFEVTNGDLTISGGSAATTGSLRKTGIAVLSLSGTNLHSGDTVAATGGALALVGSGSIASSSTIEIQGGGFFDVSSLTTQLTMASGQDLRATGTGSTGTIATVVGKGLITASNSELFFTAFNGATPPLSIQGSGTLSLQPGNSVSVTVNNGGNPLGVGDYKLISKGTTGNVTGLPTGLTVNGDGVNGTPSLDLISGELYLRIAAANTPPDIAPATANVAVGTPNAVLDVDSVFSDVDGDEIGNVTIQSVTGGPVSASAFYNSGTHEITLTPSNTALATTAVSPYVVAYTVFDDGAPPASTQATFTVYYNDPPLVSTTAATAVTTDAATLNGTANNNVLASTITARFRYSATNPGTCNDVFGSRAPAAGGSTLGGGGAFSENITGLSPSTTYYYCAIASNLGGTTVGTVLNFTTDPAGPAKYRSVATGFWADASTWEVSTDGGTVWVPASVYPTSVDDTITIRSPHTVLITSSISPTVDQTTIDAGGTLNVSSGLLTVADGLSDDLVNNGTLTISLAGEINIPGQLVNNSSMTIGGIFRIINGVATGSGTYAWDPFAQLHFNNDTFPYFISSGTALWPAVNGPQDIRVNGAGGLQLDAARSITSISIGGPVTGANNLTITDLASIQLGGSVSGSPTYGPTSSLAYNIGALYLRGDEWLPGATSGAGVPNNVGIGGNTTLNLPSGTTDQEFLMTGDLTVDPGAKLTMAGIVPPLQHPSNDKGRKAELGLGTGMTEALRVLGDVTLSGGELELSNADLGDLYVGGDWNNPTGTLTNNGRLVAFNGSGPQAINGTTDFGHLAITTTTARTVTFHADSVTAVDGSLTLTGTAGNLLSLRSSVLGQQWDISKGSTNQDVDFVDVQDSNASVGLTINATNSVDSGNNLNWNFVVVNPGVFSFDPVSYSPGEADGTATITVKRNGGTTGIVQVNYSATAGIPAATGGASCAFGSGVDYVTPSGTLTFPNGDDTETFDVTICNDQLFEGTEQFNVTLSNPTNGATIGTGTAPVNILDNDVQPSLQFTASNYDVNENGGTSTVTVTRTGALEHQLTVNYAALVGGITNPATPGTCGAFTGADFVATSGTLTFVPNDLSETFQITICNDNLFEANNETIAIALNTQSAPAVLGNPNEGTVTILPNNDPPTVQFSVAAANAPEGISPYVATVTRSGAGENAFNVNYTTTNGTAVSGACGSGGDYALTSGTLNFLGGEPSLPINVPICDDAVFEGDQTFTITLSDITGVGVIGATNPQTVTIVDNDSAPTLAINDLGILEGNAGFSFLTLTVSKVGATELVTTVNFQSIDLTATSSVAGVCGDTGIDYVGGSGGLSFQPNETSMPVTLMICGDVEVEPNETYAVTLSGALNATISDDTGIGTIINDDIAPGILVVDNISDNIAMNACVTGTPNDCSLRGANSIAQDGDTISFDSGIFALEGTSQTITLAGSELVISDDITINGPGADKLTIDAAGASRIFYFGGLSANLSGVTLTGGNGNGTNPGLGGAIRSIAALTLDSVAISGNSSAAIGGGVSFATSGSVIRDSTISGNTAGDGGGIYHQTTLTIENSTISGNTGTGQCGGTSSSSNSLIVRNSTITQNQGGGFGGGICTLNLDIGNTIVSGNNAATLPEMQVRSIGSAVSIGFNLIGDSVGDSAATELPIPYLSTDILDTPALLGSLAGNGGPTFTHKPQTGWPGHDKGCAFGAITDQRGAPRTIDWSSVTNAACSNPSENGTDIGAFELLVPTAVPATVGGRILTAGGRGIINVRVTVHNMQGDLVASANTGTFGYYKLHGLTTGASYVVTVKSKRFVFAKPSRVLSIDDNIEDFDFVADP